MSNDIQIGIIGGSGLYDMAELTDREERTIDDAVRRAVGSIRHRDAAREARRVPIAARRGPPPAAVGAEFPRQHLRHEGARRRAHPVGERRRQPEDGIQAARHRRARSVLRSHEGADQHLLRQRHRRRTSRSRTRCATTCRRSPPIRREQVGATVHRGGTYVNMEGPQFSTLAESKLYRSWGMDVIGMTNLQEAKLAREAEICYATLALVTDYDCWHPDHDSVTVDLIIANLTQNAVTAQKTIARRGRDAFPARAPAPARTRSRRPSSRKRRWYPSRRRKTWRRLSGST